MSAVTSARGVLAGIVSALLVLVVAPRMVTAATPLRCASFDASVSDVDTDVALSRLLLAACERGTKLDPTAKSAVRAQGEHLLARLPRELLEQVSSSLPSPADVSTCKAMDATTRSLLRSHAPVPLKTVRACVDAKGAKGEEEKILFVIYGATRQGLRVVSASGDEITEIYDLGEGAIGAVVPKNAYFTILDVGPRFDVPFATMTRASDDDALTLPSAGYVDVRVDLPDDRADRALLIDGVFVGEITGTHFAHRFALPLDRNSSASFVIDVLSREEERSQIDARTEVPRAEVPLRPEYPRSVRIDLSQTDRVALLGVNVASSCAGAGIDAQALAAQVATFFRTRVEGRTLDDRYGHFSALIRQMRASSSEFRLKDSPTIGILGVDRELPDVAALLWQQGFGEALQIDVECARRRDATQYTLVARKLNARDAAKTLLTGANVPVIRVATNTADRVDELRALLDIPLATLFDVPYARFIGRSSGEWMDDPSFDVEVHADEPTSLEYRYSRVDDANASACDAVAKFDRLQIDRVMPMSVPSVALGTKEIDVAGQLAWDIRPTDTSKPEPDRASLTLRPEYDIAAAGRYLLAARIVQRDGRTSDWAIRCVRVEDARWMMSAGFSVAGQISHTAATANEYGAHVEMFPVIQGKAFLSLGGWLGYTYSRHSLSERPSWDDPAAPPSQLTWKRHGVEAGPVIRLEWLPFCVAGVTCGKWATHFALVHEAGLLLDLGFIDPSGVPLAWSHFRTTPGASSVVVDPDVDVVVNNGVRFRTTPNFDVSVGLALDMRAVNDFVAARWGDRTIKSNDRVLLGANVGAGYAF